MDRQAWRDFFITVFLLGLAFAIALLSSVAADQSMTRLAATAAAVSLLLALVGALYIIPRLARNIRLEILRFAIRTTVTVEGLIFIIFLMLIGFAAWNTGNNLLYLVLSVMLAFLIAANMFARVSLADVSVQLRFPDHVFVGEPISLSVTLTNHKRFSPSFSLLVEGLSDKTADSDEETDSAEPENEAKPSPGGNIPLLKAARSQPSLGRLAYFVLAPAHASARQRIDYTFNRRGRYAVTGFRISTRFPAGFFKKWKRIDASGEIIVYPKPKPLDDFYHALPMLAGQMKSRERGSGDDLYAIRHYLPSDHMRHIDWKATAKSTKLMVREHMREDEWRLTIVFDTTRPTLSSADMQREANDTRSTSESRHDMSPGEDDSAETGGQDGFEEKFERAIVMAASLANHFILERADVELITPDARHNVRPGSGPDHLYTLLRSLATLEADGPQDDGKESPKAVRANFLRPVRTGRSRATSGNGNGGEAPPVRKPDSVEWRLLEDLEVLADERRFKVLITSAAKGTIPANVWRSSHVVFIEDL